jgi:adenylate kinase
VEEPHVDSGGTKEPLVLVLLGPPGGGKGTQAKRLAERFGLAHFSTGQLLRDEVSRNTDIGKCARAIMDAGDLVPDEVIGEMVKIRLRGIAGTPGCILDGYPRNLSQAKFLEWLRNGFRLQVVNIALESELVVRRLSGRRFCPNCGNIYNVYFSPPAEEGICDQCGTALKRRDDDYEEVIQERLRVYEEQTRPVVDFYKEQGRYQEVDGSRDPETVFESISRIVEA